MYVQQNDSQMIDQMVGSLGGYYTLSNRWGGQNFDTFNASDSWNAIPYETMFLDIYANYFEIEKFTGASGHYYAMANLLRAAAMMRVSDMYGPIPYSKVTDGQMYVAYDSNEDVYKSIIEDLNSAASVLAGYASAILTRSLWLPRILFSQEIMPSGQSLQTLTSCVQQCVPVIRRHL